MKDIQPLNFAFFRSFLLFAFVKEVFETAYYAIIGIVKNIRVFIGIYRNHRFRAVNSAGVLDSARDTYRNLNLRAYRLPRKPYLLIIRYISRIDKSS